MKSKNTGSSKEEVLSEKIPSSTQNMLLILILLFGFYIRCINLEAPLLDVHSWRQTQTAMFARNFYRNGYNIFLPQVDWQGEKPGYIEAEFQLYPYIVALLYNFFGIKEAIGRLVSVIFSIFSMYLLFLLARYFFDFWISTIAVIFFVISPLNVFFSRAFMPESTMLFFSIASIYLFLKWVETEMDKYFYLSAIATCCAFLVKIPTIYISFPLIFIAYCKFGWKMFINLKLYLFFFMVMIPTASWYIWAYQLGKASGLTVNIWSIGQDKWGNMQVWSDPTFYTVILGRIYSLILTPVLAPFAILGMLLKCKKKTEYLFHFWILGIIIYFFASAIGNKVHSYYQLPLVFPLSYFVAKGISLFMREEIAEKLFYKKASVIVVSVILILFAWTSYIYIKPSYNIMWQFYLASQEVKKHTKKNDLILVGDWSYPEVMYYSDRKGYHINPWETEPSIVENYKKAKYLVVVYPSRQHLKPQWNDYLKNIKVVSESDVFTIARINEES